jgi:hypothetical protein
VLLLVAGPLWTLASGRVALDRDWRTASMRPAGLAPDPATHREAIVQVYAGRAFGWRGAFTPGSPPSPKMQTVIRATR